MLVMLICMIVGAMFFRWLQDEDYMRNIKTGNKTYIEKRYYKVNKRMNFVRMERSKCRNFCSRTRESPRITVSWEKATDVQKEKLNWFTVNI